MCYYTHFSRSAVPSVNSRGERLLLYIGIIDILQNYRLKKRIEHALKSMIADSVRFLYILIFSFVCFFLLVYRLFVLKREISVCHPKLYSARFINFMTNQVFRKASKCDFASHHFITCLYHQKNIVCLYI